MTMMIQIKSEEIKPDSLYVCALHDKAYRMHACVHAFPTRNLIDESAAAVQKLAINEILHKFLQEICPLAAQTFLRFFGI